MTRTNIDFPRLKFCGFTHPEDLEDALRSHIDAIGLNFYPNSPRCLSTAQATDLARRAKGKALRVGVFVDESPEAIGRLVADDVIDVVQLHGDEDLEYLHRFRSQSELALIPILRAVSWRGTEYPQDAERCREWASQAGILGFLVDAHDPIQRGGTGKRARWDLLTPRPEAFLGLPFLLAGGITSENAEEAIRLVHPDGLDLASGIESSPGRKDPSKMTAVISAARKAWGESPV
jgi:phosphoribosylanthranilate isomerase